MLFLTGVLGMAFLIEFRNLLMIVSNEIDCTLRKFILENPQIKGKTFGFSCLELKNSGKYQSNKISAVNS